MKQATRFITFLAAGLCLAVSLSIETDFYSRFLGSILGEGRFLWLPVLSAVTVQVARLATSWNSASFASRDMVQQATANLRISGTIATYETIEVTLFGLAYLQGGTAAAFVLFGSFFVWVSFALEIILVRSLNPKTIPSTTSQEQPAEQPSQVSGTSGGTSTERKRSKVGPSRERSAKRSTEELEAAIREEAERRQRSGEVRSMQRIADAVGCSKTTVFRVLSSN